QLKMSRRTDLFCPKAKPESRSGTIMKASTNPGKPFSKHSQKARCCQPWSIYDMPVELQSATANTC
ncbi:hypothetical protein AVEN_171798-1, partial [Araneus ventricosus]